MQSCLGDVAAQTTDIDEVGEVGRRNSKRKGFGDPCCCDCSGGSCSCIRNKLQRDGNGLGNKLELLSTGELVKNANNVVQMRKDNRKRVSTMEKTLKTKKKRSIKMPGSIVCKGCRSVIGEGVKVNTIKSIVGELRKYKIRCPGCGYKIVLERTFGDNEYIITEGAVFDWAGWRKKRSEEYFERVAPGSYVRDLDVFKTFHIALMVGNPLTDGPYQAI